MPEKLTLKFWYPCKKILCPSLIEGVPARWETDYLGEGHIMHQTARGDSLLCGADMAIVKKEVGATTKSVRETRIESVRLCDKCAEAYRTLPGTLWYQWEHAVAA
jgi:hypothetical protein